MLASGRGREYLVEPGLEHDGYDALRALVSDYVEQSPVLADVPMAVSPAIGTRSSNPDGPERSS